MKLYKSSGSSNRPGMRQRVLIADDDTVFARRLSDYLDAHGFESRVARRISEAKELVEFWRPDAVLIDLLLPETSAMTLLRFIHSRGFKKSPKVIVTSQQVVHEGIDQVHRAGASHYLLKPFLFEEALRAINSNLGHTDDQRRETATSLKEPPASIKELHLIDLFLRQATQKKNASDRLYNLMRMINLKVDGLRTSLIHCVNDQTAVVLASNDNENVQGTVLAMGKYPELQEVRASRSVVVISDAQKDHRLADTEIARTPYGTMVLFPVYREQAFYGILSLRLKKKDPLEIFYVEKFGQVCSQILSLSWGRAS